MPGPLRPPAQCNSIYFETREPREPVLVQISINTRTVAGPWRFTDSERSCIIAVPRRAAAIFDKLTAMYIEYTLAVIIVHNNTQHARLARARGRFRVAQGKSELGCVHVTRLRVGRYFRLNRSAHARLLLQNAQSYFRNATATRAASNAMATMPASYRFITLSLSLCLLFRW